MILNEDLFPHDEEEQDDAIQMVVAFFLHLFHDLRSDTIKGILLRMWPAFGWVITQLMLLLALNVAIPADNTILLIQLAGAYIISTALWHISVGTFENLKLGGKARMILRRAVVSTMVQLTNAEAEKYPSGECLAIMSEQVENAVNVVWVGLLNVWGSCFLLFLMTALSVYLTRNTPYILPIPFVMMIIDVVVLFCRVKGQVRLFSDWIDQDNKCKAMVVEMSEQRQLITAYRSGFKMETKFVKENKEQNQRRFDAVKYQQVTEKLIKWNHTVWIICTFILGAMRASKKIIKPGDYAIIMTTILNYDREITLLFTQLFAAVNGFVSVQRIANLLNAPTRRKALLSARYRRQRILKELSEAQPEFQFDPDCISLYDVEYDYEANRDLEKRKSDGDTDEVTSQPESGVHVNVIGEEVVGGKVGPVTMVLEQGQIVCVQAGMSSAGKKTFLQLLGRVLLPTRGIIYYPDNLRVRYVPGEPLLFATTLMENLRFGNQKEHSDEEIWECCRIVGLGTELIGKSDLQVGVSGSKLSLSSRIYICLARALLSSVDLLLLSNALDMLGPGEGRAFLSMLGEWRRERGMTCLSADNTPPVPVELKKKKTVFFVTRNHELQDCADAAVTLRPTPQTSLL